MYLNGANTRPLAGLGKRKTAGVSSDWNVQDSQDALLVASLHCHALCFYYSRNWLIVARRYGSARVTSK